MPRKILEGMPGQLLPTTSGRKTEPTMVPWDKSNGTVSSTPKTTHNEAQMRPRPMGAMLCNVVPEASQQTTGNGPGQLKKLA